MVRTSSNYLTLSKYPQSKTYVPLLLAVYIHPNILDLQTWKLTKDGKLINKHSQNKWLHHNKTWSFEPYDIKEPVISPSAFYIIQHDLADSKYLCVQCTYL